MLLPLRLSNQEWERRKRACCQYVFRKTCNISNFCWTLIHTTIKNKSPILPSIVFMSDSIVYFTLFFFFIQIGGGRVNITNYYYYYCWGWAKRCLLDNQISTGAYCFWCTWDFSHSRWTWTAFWKELSIYNNGKWVKAVSLIANWK